MNILVEDSSSQDGAIQVFHWEGDFPSKSNMAIQLLNKKTRQSRRDEQNRHQSIYYSIYLSALFDSFIKCHCKIEALEKAINDDDDSTSELSIFNNFLPDFYLSYDLNKIEPNNPEMEKYIPSFLHALSLCSVLANSFCDQLVVLTAPKSEDNVGLETNSTLIVSPSLVSAFLFRVACVVKLTDTLESLQKFIQNDEERTNLYQTNTPKLSLFTVTMSILLIQDPLVNSNLTLHLIRQLLQYFKPHFYNLESSQTSKAVFKGATTINVGSVRQQFSTASLSVHYNTPQSVAALFLTPIDISNGNCITLLSWIISHTLDLCKEIMRARKEIAQLPSSEKEAKEKEWLQNTQILAHYYHLLGALLYWSHSNHAFDNIVRELVSGVERASFVQKSEGTDLKIVFDFFMLQFPLLEDLCLVILLIDILVSLTKGLKMSKKVGLLFYEALQNYLSYANCLIATWSTSRHLFRDQ